MYLIDDITGELYASHQGELIAIKEQGYLQKEMAEEEYLSSQGGRYIWDEKTTLQSEKLALVEIQKILQMSAQPDENISVGQNPEKILRDELVEQNKKTIAKATSMLQEYHTDAHRQAIVQWNLKRKERKQMKRDLLQYQMAVTSGKWSYQSRNRTGKKIH